MSTIRSSLPKPVKPGIASASAVAATGPKFRDVVELGKYIAAGCSDEEWARLCSTDEYDHLHPYITKNLENFRQWSKETQAQTRRALIDCLVAQLYFDGKLSYWDFVDH